MQLRSTALQPVHGAPYLYRSALCPCEQQLSMELGDAQRCHLNVFYFLVCGFVGFFFFFLINHVAKGSSFSHSM